MQPSRRAIAKGAAWAAPTISLAVAAPASAVSPAPLEKGMQGWAFWSRDCSSGASGTLSLSKSETGQPSDLFPSGKYGYYVYNTLASQISGACMTFSYPAYLGNLTWRATAANRSWSVPKQVQPALSNYTTYVTCYSGPWLDVKATTTTPAFTQTTGYPGFVADSAYTCTRNALTIYITRSVTVDGKPLTFDRTVTI